MKTPDRHPLLNALSSDAQSDCAPTLDLVLALARAERRRRECRRAGALAAAAAFVIAALWIMRPAAPQPATAKVAATKAAETISPPAAAPASSIQHVSDQELLDLLGNTPAALVQLPDGRQRLMLLVATRPAPR
jgi:hypothetical protein